MHRRTFVQSALALPFALPRPARAAGDGPVKLRDLYRKGGGLSDLGRSLLGERIAVDGFMAPPLRAQAQFFVLTKMPMAVCPFCETAAQWPSDILAVYTKRTVDVLPFNLRIAATGVLEDGAFRDPATGFVSLLRLTGATYA